MPKSVFIAVLMTVLATTFSYAGIPAFPGAEGFGSDTIGGRGGTVIHVTTLADSGPGSLRAAVEATGPRIIVFDVSGTIVLENMLVLRNSHVTIAGQTSPGGISVAGATFSVWAHDVIIRHMHFRTGTANVVYNRDSNGDIIYYDRPQYSFPPDGGVCQGNVTTAASGMPCAIAGGANPETLDTFSIYGGTMQSWFSGADAHNIIIDHCSFSWGVDETVTLGTGAHDITIQWSIIAEGLGYAGHPKGEHSKGLLLSYKYGGVNRISVHKNYMTGSQARQPLISGGDRQPGDFVDVRNNIIKNGFKNGNSTFEYDGAGNAIGNWFKKTSSAYNTFSGWNTYGTPSEYNHIYLEGNRGTDLNINPADPEWNIQVLYPAAWTPETWRKATPYEVPSEYRPRTFTASEEFANCVVNRVGAMVPVVDSVDQRLKTDWSSNSYIIPRNISYPEDYPTYASTSPQADTDSDGMPDAWEIARGTKPTIADDALYTLNARYTNIEVYINELADSAISVDAACMNVIQPPTIESIITSE
ncbi:MAG: hypothetical protein C0618_04755 [Desulfuromonas sp.]|nr:MAG: hypothetical protein C0618_04755 [Desulfuromonas sp.]